MSIRMLAVWVAVTFAATVSNGASGNPLPFPLDRDMPSEDEQNRLPKVVERTEPVLPPHIAARGLTDRVWVAIVVNSDGRVTRARAFFGRHQVLEEAAVEAVKKWTFTPGAHLGRKVNTQMVVPFEFAPPTT